MGRLCCGALFPWGCHRPLGLGVMEQAWGAPHLSLAPWGCLDTLLQASVGMGADAGLIPDFGAGIYGGDVLQLMVLTAQLGSLMC